MLLRRNYRNLPISIFATLVAQTRPDSREFRANLEIYQLRTRCKIAHLTVADPVVAFTLRPHLWGEVRYATRRDELGA